MVFTQKKIKEIKEMDIEDREWGTPQYPYMTNDQIIKVHRHIYDSLIKRTKKYRDSIIGNILNDFDDINILIDKLLIETEKRFKKG